MSVNIVNGDTLDTDFTSLANHIRAKTGSATTLTYVPGDISEFTDAIDSISGGGGGVNHNLLTSETQWVDGYVISNTGVISASASHRYSELIPVTTGDILLVVQRTNGQGGDVYVRLIGYDANGNFTSCTIDQTVGWNNLYLRSYSAKIPSGTTQVRVVCGLDDYNYGDMKAYILQQDFTFEDPSEYDVPNLIVNTTWTTGYIIDANGVISENANYRYSDFIDVTQGFLALIFKNEGGGVLYGYVRVIGYDSNGTFTSALLDNSFARNNSFVQKITVPSGTVKVRVSCELSSKTHINLMAQTFVNY